MVILELTQLKMVEKMNHSMFILRQTQMINLKLDLLWLMPFFNRPKKLENMPLLHMIQEVQIEFGAKIVENKVINSSSVLKKS